MMITPYIPLLLAILLLVSLADLILIKLFLRKSEFREKHGFRTFCYIWSGFLFSALTGMALTRYAPIFKTIAGLNNSAPGTAVYLFLVAATFTLYLLIQNIRKLKTPDKALETLVISLPVFSLFLFIGPALQLIFKIVILTFLLSYSLMAPSRYPEQTPGRVTWFFSCSALVFLAMHISAVTTMKYYFFKGILTWQFLIWLIMSGALLAVLAGNEGWKKNYRLVSLCIIVFSLCLMSVCLRSDRGKSSSISKNLLVLLTVPEDVSDILSGNRLKLRLQINQVYNSFIDLGKDVWTHLEKENYYWKSFYLSPMRPEGLFSAEAPYIKGKSLRNGVSFGIEEFSIDDALRDRLAVLKKLNSKVAFKVFVMIDSQGIATVKKVELLKELPPKPGGKSINIEFHREPEFRRN